MRRALGILSLCGAMACASSGQEEVETEISAPTMAEGESIRVENALGPVVATVVVTPKSPLIGDLMSLTLSVEAKDGVELTMPRSREAFSRFEISDEDEARETIDGGERHTQSYQIQTSSSGRLRIPPMRIVFVDTRPGEESDGAERELLTDEISIMVRSVLAGDEATAATIRPIRRPLEEHLGPSLARQYWWAIAGGALLVCVLFLIVYWRHGRKVIQISPYERASVALSELEAEGLPDEDALDGWYVELSSIVRRYLEDRFALRAPELTTEEFLRVAQRSQMISTEHKTLLSSFLADCDQVKFAGYAPGEEESRSALAAARRFLLETRELDGIASSPVETEATNDDLPVETEAA